MADKTYINPQFVSAALAGITHRFVLILECETRHYGDPKKQNKYTPPRFSVGGPRANQDPRIVPVEDLLCITTNKNEIQIPSGWEKLHQYIYVKHHNTDDHGWQYRTDWSVGVLSPQDEQWVGVNADGRDVRRRLWMTTVVRKDDMIRAKRILSETLQKSRSGTILQGDLFKLEQGTISKTWVRRTVRLQHDALEFYSGNDFKGRIHVQGCEVKMLFGSQCPGRDFAFSIRHPSGNVGILLDADNKEIRRRWVVAISYQVALNWPDVNFPPFDYGPPIENEGLSRVLICGELSKRGHMVKSWKTRFFQLTPRELQYYEKENLKGKVSVEDATVEFDDRSLEFTLVSSSGAALVMRADSATTKATWVRAIQRQIQSLKDSKQSPQVLTEKEIEEVKVANKERAAKLEEEKLQRVLESQAPPKEEPKESVTPVKVEIVAELSQVIAESATAIISADETGPVVDESWNADEAQTQEQPVASAVSVKVVEAVVNITEEEDEKEVDPYLQYGGQYYEDPKNSAEFSYIMFNDIPKFTSAHSSLMARYLTPELFKKLKTLKTSKGYTLSNLITAGVISPSLEIGATAGDEESWTLFKDLLYPIVSDWHGVDIGTFTNTSDLDSSSLVIDDATKILLEHSVVSSTMYSTRNISGFSLPAGTLDSDRAAVEFAVKDIVAGLTPDNAGTYYPLGEIEPTLQEELKSKQLLFEIPSVVSKLSAAGGARSWPNNRGIFVDSKLTAATWVNDEDHIRVITQHKGGDVKAAFARFSSFLGDITKSTESLGLKFMHSPELGYLTTCPSELGTAFKVTLIVHLPEINKIMQTKKKADLDNVVRVCDTFAVDVDGSDGLLSAAEGDNFFISNAQRFGVTEVVAAQRVISGTAKLVEIDKLIANGADSAKIAAFIDNGFKEVTMTIDTKQPVSAASNTKSPTGPAGYRNATLSAPAPSKQKDGPTIPKNVEVFSPTKLRPSRANRALEKQVDQKTEEQDEFGMITINVEIDAALEARMSKHLLKAAKEKRSSFVLKQVAKHEKYFEDNGISKDAPSLGKKIVYNKYK